MELDPETCRRAVLARDTRFDGRFFTGVKTTGIYCRPICPARRPKGENCTYHPSAAAAESAGFRACLRCRPESAPDLGAWRGTSNTVSRGLALIEQGALDGGDVEALAERLGVGGRQLRRLFRRHLGAAPLDVAQTRRVLLAKTLIQSSTLPMTEVALASGFGSVRRFNATFQALYGRPPGALRRLKGEARPSGPLVLMLAAAEPYDFAGLLAALAERGDDVRDGRWRRDLTPGEANVTYAGHGRLRAELTLSTLADLPRVVARLRRVFDLAVDPLAIDAALAEDPRLRSLIAAHPGLRIPGCWDDVPAFDDESPWRPWGAYARRHLHLAAKEASHALAA